MQLLTFFENVDSLRRKPADIHEGRKELPNPLHSPSSCRVNLLFSPQASPSCPAPASHHQLLLIHSQRQRQTGSRQGDIRDCPCCVPFPCHSTRPLFLLARPSPDHSGTSSVLSCLHDFAHAVLEDRKALSLPLFATSKSPTVFASQL